MFMAPQKRKQPDRKKKGRPAPGIASRAAVGVAGALFHTTAAVGGVFARYPSISGGCMAFAIVFGFVSANALWYQPGEHPSPMFRTRDQQHPEALVGHRTGIQADAGDVTTFKIERPDGTETASIDRQAASEATAPVSAIVRDVQRELIRRGLYNGVADGVSGPRTAAAILFFEETVGMEQSGEATPQLLAALKASDFATSDVGTTAKAGNKTTDKVTTVPKNRPAEDVSSAASEEDPVAAAIRQADRKIKPEKASASATAGKSLTVNQVMKIQRGLAKMAYTIVGIDGVAGEQTRTAIRHFERHYRLPETGTPNADVLNKLKEIGAI